MAKEGEVKMEVEAVQYVYGEDFVVIESYPFDFSPPHQASHSRCLFPTGKNRGITRQDSSI